jgi:hypothetical protein
MQATLLEPTAAIFQIFSISGDVQLNSITPIQECQGLFAASCRCAIALAQPYIQALMDHMKVPVLLQANSLLGWLIRDRS